MSSSALPITPQHFAEAILDLPLPTLHFKAAEIRNSISHLESSNSQLQKFADEGDKDCGDAVEENKDTMLRMEERITMLRREVERRGFQWGPDAAAESRDGQERRNGHVASQRAPEDEVESHGPVGDNVTVQQRQTSIGGSVGDAALASRPLERIDSEEEVDDGIHL